MQITEKQVREIKGCYNILTSLQEDEGIEEFVRDMLLPIEETLVRIVKEIERGELNA